VPESAIQGVAVQRHIREGTDQSGLLEGGVVVDVLLRLQRGVLVHGRPEHWRMVHGRRLVPEGLAMRGVDQLL
jgi:hypothetical protein